jgi:hypothetical protein
MAQLLWEKEPPDLEVVGIRGIPPGNPVPALVPSVRQVGGKLAKNLGLSSDNPSRLQHA